MIDLLVIAPHPDDAELGMGGRLARAKAQGHSTGVVDLTRGEAATTGTAEVRAQEAERAAQVLGLDVRRNLGWPDSRVMDSVDRRLQLAHLFRELRPAVVIGPHGTDRHPDHIAAAHIVPAALHLAGLRNTPLSGEPFKPRALFYYMGNEPFDATLIVDVSGHMDTWEAAVRCYGSRFGPAGPADDAEPEVIRRRRGRATYWGSFIGVTYGEPLLARRPVSYFPL